MIESIGEQQPTSLLLPGRQMKRQGPDVDRDVTVSLSIIAPVFCLA